LVQVEPTSGKVEPIADLPGYPRGLACHGSWAFIALSRIRETSLVSGVPIAARASSLLCGLAVVDLGSGLVVGHMEFRSEINELFDVQILANVRSPFLAGPNATRDAIPPPWTIPPWQGWSSGVPR
jgi:uncharacterized protein (TIGR03032 family)